MAEDDEYFLEKLEDWAWNTVSGDVPIQKMVLGFALVLGPLISRGYQHSDPEINDLWNQIVSDLNSGDSFDQAVKSMGIEKLAEIKKDMDRLHKLARDRGKGGALND